MIELAAGPASEAAGPPEPDEAFPREASTQPLRRSKWLGSSAAPAPAPGASLAAGTLNLLNTIVGGGILALPFAFRSCGLLTGVLYQLVFGAMSWYGCYLLLDCLQHAKTATSFEALAQAAFGRAGFLAYNLAALVNCYGACVSYVIVVGDVLEPLCRGMGLPLTRPTLLSLAVGGIILPLSSLRDISSLRCASALAITIYALFVLCLLLLPLLAPRDDVTRLAPLDDEGGGEGGGGGGGGRGSPALLRPDAAGWIRAVPLCAFAFMCQTSLFPIYQETRAPTRPRMLCLTSVAISTAIAIYAASGAAALSYFGDTLQGDVLLNLAAIDSHLVRAVRLGFGVSICLTYPCLHYAARRSIDQLLFGSAAEGAGRGTPEWRLRVLTLLIVGSTLVLGLVLRKVEVVFGFTGALASTALSYCLPAAIHLRLTPLPARALRRTWRSAAFLLVGLLLGLVSFGNHAYNTLAALGEEATPNATPHAIPNEEQGGAGGGPSLPLPNSTTV